MDKKELLKLTVPKLREEALKIENIAGVHGMGKTDLLDILFDKFNIPVEKKKKRDTVALKKQASELRAKKEEVRAAGDKKQVKILQRKIHTLKRHTR